jgi:hypothetical protein
MPLKPGDSLLNGQYLILKLLGKGGFGHVFRAEDTLLGIEVAITELLPALAGDEVMLRRFLAEARVTMQLSHCHIHSIPSLSGDFRLTAVGQYEQNGNNCGFGVGLSDRVPQQGEHYPGAAVWFDWTGGGCPNHLTRLTASWSYPGGGTGWLHHGYECGGSNGVTIEIEKRQPYEAVLMVERGTATLRVSDTYGYRVGKLSEPVERDLGELDVLWLRLAAHGDWPSCWGWVDSVIIETLP